MKKNRPAILAKSIGALLAITGLAPLAPAGQVWDGGGGNGLWSTAANWDADTLPSFATPLAFGGLLQLASVNDATASVAGLTFNAGAGAFTLSGSAITLNGGMTNNSANTQTVSFTAITLGSAQIFNASTAALLVTTGVDLGVNTLTIDGANGTTLNGAIIGTGGLTKNGAGILGLGGLNTYSGTTIVNDGVVQSLTGGAFSPNSDFTVTGTGILDLASNDSTIQALKDGGLTTGRVSNSAATAASLTLGNNNASGSFGGLIEAFGAGPLGITKIGTGTQTFSGNNTYTGPTTVNGGTLKAGVATVTNISGAFGVNSAVSMANAAGATLDITGFDTQIGSLTGGGALGGNVTLGTATLTLGADNTSPAAYAGVISSTGVPATSVIKIGTGVQIFARNSTYTGDTLLQGGSLFSDVSPGAGTNRAFGTGGRLVISGGTRIGSGVNNQTIFNDLSFINPVSPVTIEASTHLNFPGAVNLNGGTRTLVGNVNQAEIAFNGVISNGSLTFNTANLIPPGGGISPYVAFIFAGASTHTYTGLTTVNDGAFIVFNTGGQKITGDVLIQGNGVVDYLTGSNQISDTSTVTVNSSGSTITGPAVFQGLELFNKSDTIGALFGTGTVGLGSGTLTVGAGNFTGVIKNGGMGVGGKLVKNTTGTLTLTGTNTYTGLTTVSAGTLVAGKNDALPAAAAVTVSIGAAFDYHATANAPLAIGALTLNSGAGTAIGGSIGSTFTGAQITVAGIVTPTPGAIKVNVFGVPGVATGAPGTYTLLTAGAGSALDAAGITYSIGNVYNATNFTVSAVGAPNATTITATIIAAAPLTAAYWVGGLPGNPSMWSASNGIQSNWTKDAAGTMTTPLVPGMLTNVFFSADDLAPLSPTDPGSMTLGADMSIASLTINAATAPETRAVKLNDDGFTLTIAGAGGITIKAGAGAVTLNPHLILGAGQTWTNNSSNLFSVKGNVSNGASLLTVTGSGNTTLSGVLGNGSGGLTKSGTGTLTLVKNNTYTGDTRLLGGALFADVAPGSAANTPFGIGGALIIAGGTLLGSHVNQQTIPNNLSFIDPTSAVTIEAHTELHFTGNADLNGGTRTLTGTIHSSEIAFSGVIGSTGGTGGVTFGTAGLVPPGDGTSPFVAFIYNGTTGHTYTGLTTVNSGAFLVFEGPAQKVLGNVLIQGNGVVEYLGTSDQIADTATVTVNSTGSTITGPTKFAGFELRNNSDTIGALFGNGTVGLGSGTLTVGAGNFSGVVGDGTFGPGGTLVKNTIGTLTLSGANTYTGNTFINNGTLILDGSVQSPNVFVNFAGTLMGTGTAMHGVRNAGIFSPGNGRGTFRIGGRYTQTGAGTLIVEIAGTQAGQHDLVAVGGQAALDGTLRLVKVGNARLKVGDKITFLTAAGGVSGRFAHVVNPFAAPSGSTTTNAAGATVSTTQLKGGQLSGTILETAVVYESNAVSLEATQGSFELFAQRQFLTPNQRTVASMLDQVVADSGAKKLIAFLNGEPLERLPDDFDRIAPDELQALYTIGASQANVQTANLQRRMDDIRAGHLGFSAEGLSVSGTIPPFLGGGVPGSAGATGPEGKTVNEVRQPESELQNSKEIRPPAEMRIGVFITGTGEFAKVGDTARARGYDLATGGFTLGVDYRVNEHFTVGLNTGYARTGSDGSGGSRVSVDGAKLGAYATYFTGEGFYADAALQGGYNSYDTRRSALQGTASGSTTGGEVTALIATGFDFTGDALRIGPTASFQYTHIGFTGYEESGSLAPLRYGSQSSTSMRTALGLKAAYELHYGTVVVRPELRAAWQHEFGDVHYAIDSALAGGGPTFTVQGAEIGRESLLLGTGVAVLWNERTATYLFYDGELGRTNYNSNNVSAGVRLSF